MSSDSIPPATTPTGGDHPADESVSFADLGLRDELLAALAALGYEEPTPIQREAIPPMLAGRDLLGQAATGTGKTAAFALPLLQRLPATAAAAATRSPWSSCPPASSRCRSPRRSTATARASAHASCRSTAASRSAGSCAPWSSAWTSWSPRPGRALDHIARGTLDLGELVTVVLDEADEMLDMGFAEDIEAILEHTPQTRQTVLFSATMPSRIDGMARQHLTRPGPHRDRPGAATCRRGAPLVRQSAYIVARAHKPAALGRVLDVESPTAAIVFCRSREEVDRLTETMNGRGYRAEALHGGMSQEQRDRVMGRLRAGTADLLVATDVAARGLDVEQLTHVVNYDVPSAPESYVHRIGRVGPGRPGGRGHHPGRAARAPDAQDHRAGHRPAASRSSASPRWRTCGPAGWS